MHDCMRVDEIIRLFACELVASRRKASAVALACSCKTFEDPVLDVLWETQKGLLPLFRSLPGDVWNGNAFTVSASIPFTCLSLNYLICKSFERLPTTLEWARFRKYARRMRALVAFGGDRMPLGVLSALQVCTTNKPLFPNLNAFHPWSATEKLAPFIPLFLSPATTLIHLSFHDSGFPKETVASIITILPTLCPRLQDITLHPLPSDPMIAAAVSGMLLASNQHTLQYLCVDSPLMEEAREVVYKLPNLRELLVIIEKDSSLPSVVLPNLTELTIRCDHDGDWLGVFHGATFGKLEAVNFHSRFGPFGDFLEAFKEVVITTPTFATLSAFRSSTQCPWMPNYRALLPFTQLEEIDIDFLCVGRCSSTIDDDIITDMARAMPRLEVLRLGGRPCKAPTGVTANGLAALAYHCPHLSTLRIHFQVANFHPPTTPSVTSGGTPNILREDCALSYLDVGCIPMPAESTVVVALTLLRLFPHLDEIEYWGEGGWEAVADAIDTSKRFVDHSSKKLSRCTSK